MFLPRDQSEREHCKKLVEKLIADHGQTLVGWREVPVDHEKADLGPTALAGEPRIEQLVIAAGEGFAGDDFER